MSDILCGLRCASRKEICDYLGMAIFDCPEHFIKILEPPIIDRNSVLEKWLLLNATELQMPVVRVQ